MTPLDIESLREHHLSGLERQLLDAVEELTRQRDDARTKAINAGIFTSSDGDESKYTHAMNTEFCEGCGWNLTNDQICDQCETELYRPRRQHTRRDELQTVIVIETGWESPPMRSNDRAGWREKAAHTAVIRSCGKLLGHGQVRKHGAITGPVTVTLVWVVTDNRRRDVGSSSPTLKAFIDGLVDAKLIAGDHWKIVTEERLRIELGSSKTVRIEIQETT